MEFKKIDENTIEVKEEVKKQLKYRDLLLRKKKLEQEKTDLLNRIQKIDQTLSEVNSILSGADSLGVSAAQVENSI